MKHASILAAVVIFGIIAPHATQAAASNCAKRDMIVDRLTTKFGETRQSVGLGRNNALVETFASAASGTWTILVTLPTGVSCLLASGQAWDGSQDAPVIAGEDA
jgi:hypothetical protein